MSLVYVLVLLIVSDEYILLCVIVCLNTHYCTTIVYMPNQTLHVCKTYNDSCVNIIMFVYCPLLRLLLLYYVEQDDVYMYIYTVLYIYILAIIPVLCVLYTKSCTVRL